MISFKSILASALALPLLASAILITDPTDTTVATKGGELNVTWTSVDTDPATFGILLVNFVYWPPSYIQLAYDVPTLSNTTTVRVPCGTIGTDGYQINAINGTNTYVIYAQSSKFNVTGADCVDPIPPVPTCVASTVTVTATPTPTPKTKVPKKMGKVPRIVGWMNGYGSPVTLAKVPTPPPTVV